MKYSASVGNKTRAASFFVAACFLICTTSFASLARAMTEERARELAPGSYIWSPSLASEGSISMRVDLASQTAYVYRGDTLIGVSTIASGKRGYETPDGNFTVLEKERIHHSNKYDNAPMPYMQRLSWYGLALHGGHPHGYPASHGCIRMPMGFAAALFKEDTRGMEVAITGHWGGHGQTMIAGQQKVRSPVRSGDLRTTEFSDEQSGPCCAPAANSAPGSPSAFPDRSGDDDGDDQPNSGFENGDQNYNPSPSPEGQRDTGYRQRAREQPREVPPENLPPPPN